MSGAKSPKEPTELGRRILEAIEAEGRTQTSVERDTEGFSKGYLSRVIYGSRGTSIDPDKIRNLADVLHVNFEWLFIGRGPMRRGGRDTTPAEEAIVFCRRAGTREDAIRQAWDRNKDRVTEMSATDWVLAIDVEARQLDRAKIPRPEEIYAAQEGIRRRSAKLRKQTSDAAKRAVEAFDAEVRAFLHRGSSATA